MEYVVGQEIMLVSGCYGLKGKVVKVTPEGIDVLAYIGCADWTSDVGREYLLYFGKDGKERYGRGTFECGPWQLPR